MPWKKTRDARCPAGKPIAVVKVDDNDLEGCHATDAAANDQLAALNAAEREAKGMDKETQEKEPVEGNGVKDIGEAAVAEIAVVVGGPTTLADLQAARDAQAMVDGVRDLTYDFRMVADNIMHDPTVEDKAGAMRALAEEFAALVEKPPEEKSMDDYHTKERMRYKEIAADDDLAKDGDFQGGCPVCRFGDPVVMKGLDKCPFCWNPLGGAP